MIESSKPRKQRLFRYNAPMHVRQAFIHAHISKELAAKLSIRRRNIGIRRGDSIKVMNGKSRGKSGKVLSVDLKRGTVFIEGISRKNAKGKELQIPISASNVYITDLNLTDKKRADKIEGMKTKR
ncbi:MAG: 50S ribosomal protein L24 [Candidatus Micrarchaeales archaeon]|jgi:large subunit ribosomal protein L24